MTMTPSALRVYPPQTLLEERMRLAAHVCAATTHCCDKVRETFPTVPGGGRTPEKPSQPSPEEGARRDELALRRQWHLGSSRDRGGRRQWHVGIAAGAASGMSGSVRLTPSGNLMPCPTKRILSRTYWRIKRRPFSSKSHAISCPDGGLSKEPSTGMALPVPADMI